MKMPCNLSRMSGRGIRLLAVAAAAALLFVPSAMGVPPANDDFANATALSGDTGSQNGTNAEAAAEPGEPNHAGRPAYASVWYRWVAPEDGIATFDTCTASFDTRLAVYTGPAVNTLTEVASSDDSGTCSPHSLGSSLDFVADKGVTYRIAVDGFATQTGSFTLDWERVALPPTNVAKPVIRGGGTREADALSVDTGQWSSILPVSYAYQWQRCGATQRNVALGEPAWASRVWETPGYEPSKAVDGSRWTYWSSGDHAPQWIAVDLQAPYPLSKIRADITQLPDGYTVHELWVAGPNPRDEYRLLHTFAGPTKDLDILEQPGPSEPVEFIEIETTASPSWVAWREVEALSGCSDIPGATGTSYTLTGADIGSTVRAIVRAKNGSGPTAAASAETATITALAPISTAAPTIAGTARLLEMLTASPGAWRGSQPISYAYQWQRCKGTTCRNIEWATDPIYVVDYADTGAKLRVLVTASNVAGSASNASAPTAAVPYICTVPDLKRKRLAASRRSLARAHCSLGQVRRAYSRRVKRGLIVSQRPRAGRELADRGRVSVVVSRGRRHRHSRAR
jgi:F5/8 type C domain